MPHIISGNASIYCQSIVKCVGDDVDHPNADYIRLIVFLTGDKNLVTWQKAEMPLIGLPPSSLPLVGWRDPFIFEVSDSSSGGRWGMLMGSGLKGKGGSVMIYRADSLLGGEQRS